MLINKRKITIFCLNSATKRWNWPFFYRKTHNISKKLFLDTILTKVYKKKVLFQAKQHKIIFLHIYQRFGDPFTRGAITRYAHVGSTAIFFGVSTWYKEATY